MEKTYQKATMHGEVLGDFGKPGPCMLAHTHPTAGAGETGEAWSTHACSHPHTHTARGRLGKPGPCMLAYTHPPAGASYHKTTPLTDLTLGSSWLTEGSPVGPEDREDTLGLGF